MGAAIWSCPVETMVKFPAHSFLRFFANHGLIELKNRPQWKSVIGGSNQYVKKILAEIGDKILYKPMAVSVTRQNKKVVVKTADEALDF